MRKIHKKKIWLPHELSENAILNRFSIATFLFDKQRKKSFFNIVTSDEKWIYFYNAKRKKS